MKLGPLFADILIVDDDPALVRMLRALLHAAGYTVRSVTSGEAALEAVRARPPDLILLDVTLPGLDGYEVARRLKADASLPFSPLIMMTAHGRDSLAAGLNTGADEFIGKPFENAELLMRIRAMLRLKATTDRLMELEQTARRLFMTYMPRPVAEALIADPSGARPGGVRREVTILFADIEGFTTWAERVSPEQVLELLNLALAVMAQAVTQHNGTVDKFMGDGLMAIFNAPLELSQHAAQAVQAALEIQCCFAREPALAHLRINVGLHTGEAVVGNLGGDELLNYTAIGDAVNLAKRLQEMAEGGQILLSRATLDHAGACLAARPLGQRRVKGRQLPVEVYELINKGQA